MVNGMQLEELADVQRLVIEGGFPLRGPVAVEASKNAALPIIAASLLTGQTIRLPGIPWLDDVDTLCRAERVMGVDLEREAQGLALEARDIDPYAAPEHLVRRMRASFLIAGPLVARFGAARVPLPGGCAIGSRPIDLHLKGLQALGAEASAGNGVIEFRAGRLRGANIYLDFPSVGATENLLMAAAMADGLTTIENAAQEPEIVDLANFINAMGGQVRGAGTATLRVVGVQELHGCTYQVIPDRIEAGTYLLAAAATRGEVEVYPVVTEHLRPVLAKLRESGAEIVVRDDAVQLRQRGRLAPVDVKTMPYPGFPTDMQAPFLAALSTAEGTSVVTETVFENRFMHVPELRRLGADIKIEGRSAFVTGVARLSGATVRATDLRAGAALVIAGLVAEGTTTVLEAHHLDRGYRSLEAKLGSLGAAIDRAGVDG